ncbi:hypothetical protein SAMN06297144_0787 [Sphingomonas guangdongensis]|uniref:Uncharacterized protein n=1 Tax=Sphingomonas guangdongensis TaxID=1141890 RepID=A0A285QDJ0_9SPHN|nr:hypothetical protein [Sphingomonas guangdongensis]SOB79896.1 hypothetical protein SAMN06297144_0787 [Sphingomonas guangdongensis]
MLHTLILPAVLLAGAAVPASQQPAGDDAAARALGQCLVLKTTGADRLTVARWMLAAMASAPQMSDVVTVQPGQKERNDRAMAALFTRLLVTDCAERSKVLFGMATVNGFETAGEALGGVAMKELLSDPKASAALAAYASCLDKEAFKPVLPR